MMRFLPLCFVLAACSGTPEPDAPGSAVPDRAPGDSTLATEADSALTITGAVRHFDLEGGFFAIRGDDGVTYDPSNLGEEFRRDGLRIRARVRPRPDMGGIHMVGPIVDIIEIDSLPTGQPPADE